MAQSDRLATAILSHELALPGDGTILVIRAQPGQALPLLPPDQLLCEQGFRPTQDILIEQGFTVEPLVTAPAAMAIVVLTRSRPENLGNVARALTLLPPGGLLAVDGAKTDGVDSLAKLIASVIPLEGQMTKAHGRVFWLRRPATLPPVVADWQAASTLRANPEGFVTAPGMFSPDAVDPGSQRLARAFAGRLKGRVADLGAGWGWLSLRALEEPGVTQIDLYEAEFHAVEAARRNIDDPRASFFWSDVTSLRRGTPPYDSVISNPPFHQGRAAEPDLGIGFIAAAARILKPSGQFLMVANRQLPYEAALDARFKHWERLSEDGAYKVILAQRPRRD